MEEAAHHFGWSPANLQKACGPTPSKGTVVNQDGNGERLVGLPSLPELAYVLMQLAQCLLGDVPPIVVLIQATGQNVGPLLVTRLRVLG